MIGKLHSKIFLRGSKVRCLECLEPGGSVPLPEAGTGVWQRTYLLLYRQGHGKSSYLARLSEDPKGSAPRSGCLVYRASGIGEGPRKAARLPSPPDPPVPETGQKFDRCTGGTDIQTGRKNRCKEPEETDGTEDRFPGRMV